MNRVLCLLLGTIISLCGIGATQTGQPSLPGSDKYSGMYSFLRDGEFVQITIEDKGNVTGFISRFGDSESDKGVFMNQFFKSGKLDGGKLNFTTEPVHGVWFEFSGTVVRGAGKKMGGDAGDVNVHALCHQCSSRPLMKYGSIQSPRPVVRNCPSRK